MGSKKPKWLIKLQRKQIVKHNEARVFTHVHVHDRFDYELTIYAEDKAHYVFKSSITGKAIERASIAELENALKLSREGAIITPIMPPFYNRPQMIPDLIAGYTDKLLALLGVETGPGWRAESLEP